MNYNEQRMSLLNIPDLVMMKVIRLCSRDLLDIYSLRRVNTKLCVFIDQNWSRLFNEYLTVSNEVTDKEPAGVDISKPVLNMTINLQRENYDDDSYNVVKLNTLDACDSDQYLIFENEDGKREPLIITPQWDTRVAELERLFGALNLRNLQSLEIKFSSRNCFYYPYHTFLLHPALSHSASLVRLKLRVNFLCGYCSEYVAKVGEVFPTIRRLEVTNISPISQSGLAILVPLSSMIFETFSREAGVRRTVVTNIPVQCMEQIWEWGETGHHQFQVIPQSLDLVTLNFGG